MRTIKLWVGTVHDNCSRYENDYVYLFPEGTMEHQVVQTLWEEWVANPYAEDLAADPNMAGNPPPEVLPPELSKAWELLREWVGEDWSFEFQQLTTQVKQ